LTIVISAATAAPGYAAAVLQELIAYQAFVEDAALAAANLGVYSSDPTDLTGLDPFSGLNYSSTFDSTGAVNGDFTGTYDGYPLTTSADLSDSVSGDPSYMLTGGVSSMVGNGKSNDAPITVNIGNDGTLSKSSIGNLMKGGYVLGGTLTESTMMVDGNTVYTFTGTNITLTGMGGNLNGQDYKATATITVTGTGFTQAVTSKFAVQSNAKQKTGAWTLYDKGTVQFESVNNNGVQQRNMDDDAAVAPEPSGLALASIALVLAFGYRRSAAFFGT
jgi:hypothetical protein